MLWSLGGKAGFVDNCGVKARVSYVRIPIFSIAHISKQTSDALWHFKGTFQWHFDENFWLPGIYYLVHLRPCPVSQRIWTPLPRFGTPLPNFPFKHRLYHIWWRILFSSFLSMFFSITTQRSSIKAKKHQPFRSNSVAFIITSRTVYARIRCEQTTAFEPLKLLQ